MTGAGCSATGGSGSTVTGVRGAACGGASPANAGANANTIDPPRINAKEKLQPAGMPQQLHGGGFVKSRRRAAYS
jgi:hypothetical protein